MKKSGLIVIALVWILGLIVLTDLFPNYPFVEYCTIIGIGFISITGLLRIVYKRLIRLP